MRHEYVLVDVFTDRQFGGNALAVFRNGDRVPERLMQQIANELKHAETTFVLSPHEGGDHRVRIFTPDRELPFAGHPTLGTAFVMTNGANGTVTLEEGVGIIPVTFREGFGQMVQLTPTFRPAVMSAARLAEILSLGEADIRSDVPLEVGSSGVPHLLAPLRDLDALGRCRPRAGLTTENIYAFALHGPIVRGRMFGFGVGIPEDAASGSAQGPLGAYLVRHGLVDVRDRVRITSEQGIEMGRPSRLDIELELGPDGLVARVGVGGRCVLMGGGWLDLD